MAMLQQPACQIPKNVNSWFSQDSRSQIQQTTDHDHSQQRPQPIP